MWGAVGWRTMSMKGRCGGASSVVWRSCLGSGVVLSLWEYSKVMVLWKKRLLSLLVWDQRLLYWLPNERRVKSPWLGCEGSLMMLWARWDTQRSAMTGCRALMMCWPFFTTRCRAFLSAKVVYGQYSKVPTDLIMLTTVSERFSNPLCLVSECTLGWFNPLT